MVRFAGWKALDDARRVMRDPNHSLVGRRAILAGIVGAAGAAVIPSPPGFARAGGEPAQVGKTGERLIGTMSTYTTRYEDVLHDVARRFDLGFVELVAANPGVDPWLPGEGTVITLPTAHLVPDAASRGIIINLAELRLYFFSEIGTVQTVPIGIGREGRETPLGETKIVRKQENPTWFPPPSVRAERPELPAVVKPGPDNPLGSHALYLALPLYLIHGTHRPYGVGRRVSAGCIRLYPEDITRLYSQAKIGTPVTIIDQPLKLGWGRGKLWIEVHPDQDQTDEIEETGQFTPKPIQGFEQWVAAAAGMRHRDVDWGAAHRAVAERRGLPIAILSDGET